MAVLTEHAFHSPASRRQPDRAPTVLTGHATDRFINRPPSSSSAVAKVACTPSSDEDDREQDAVQRRATDLFLVQTPFEAIQGQFAKLTAMASQLANSLAKHSNSAHTSTPAASAAAPASVASQVFGEMPTPTSEKEKHDGSEHSYFTLPADYPLERVPAPVFDVYADETEDCSNVFVDVLADSLGQSNAFVDVLASNSVQQPYEEEQHFTLEIQQQDNEKTSVNVQQLKAPPLNVLVIDEPRNEWRPGEHTVGAQHRNEVFVKCNSWLSIVLQSMGYQVEGLNPLSLTTPWDPGILIIWDMMLGNTPAHMLCLGSSYSNNIKVAELTSRCLGFQLQQINNWTSQISNVITSYAYTMDFVNDQWAFLHQNDVQKNYNAKSLISPKNYLQLSEMDIIFTTFLPP